MGKITEKIVTTRFFLVNLLDFELLCHNQLTKKKRSHREPKIRLALDFSVRPEDNGKIAKKRKIM